MKVGDKVYCKESCISSVCWYTKKNWYEVIALSQFIDGNYHVYIVDNFGECRVFTIDDFDNYLDLWIFGKYFYTKREYRKMKLKRLEKSSLIITEVEK